MSKNFQGTYAVVAENEHGKAVSSSNIVLSDPVQSQEPFDQPVLDSVTSTIQSESDSEVRSTFQEASKSFRQISSSMVPNMSSPKPFRSQQFSKEQHQISQINSQTHKFTEFHRQSQPSSEVLRSSEVSRSFPPAGSGPRGYLKIERNLMNKIVHTGSEVIFEAEIIGHPDLTVLWYRNGVLIQAGSDWKMVKEGNLHKLLIREAFPEDTGLITIKAYNSTGSVESSANLLVRDTNLQLDQIPVFKYAEECSSVKQKRDVSLWKTSTSLLIPSQFFTKFVMDNSSTSSKIRSVSLERPGRQLPAVPPKPFRVSQLAGNSNNIRPADSYESLPCGYRYSSASSRSDVSESYVSAQEEGEFKPVWSPKGSIAGPKPRWKPVRPPSSNSKVKTAVSCDDYDDCYSQIAGNFNGPWDWHISPVDNIIILLHVQNGISNISQISVLQTSRHII